MNDFEPYRALSFDCYGTLIDWETGIGAALASWAAATGLDVGESELVSTFSSVESLVQQQHPSLRYPLVLEEVLRRVGAHYSTEVTPAAAEQFGASVSEWPAFPDSVTALRLLQTRFKLVILSNVDRGSFAGSNERLGVEFDLIVTADDVGAYKPSPESFPALLARLGEIGVQRKELLHVAQSLYHDHEPAQRVDLPSVWIDRRHSQPGFGATPPPRGEVTPRWRYRSLADFAAAAVPAG